VQFAKTTLSFYQYKKQFLKTARCMGGFIPLPLKWACFLKNHDMWSLQKLPPVMYSLVLVDSTLHWVIMKTPFNEKLTGNVFTVIRISFTTEDKVRTTLWSCEDPFVR
jgi:hypothetical protein